MEGSPMACLHTASKNNGVWGPCFSPLSRAALVLVLWYTWIFSTRWGWEKVTVLHFVLLCFSTQYSETFHWICSGAWHGENLTFDAFWFGNRSSESRWVFSPLHRAGAKEILTGLVGWEVAFVPQPSNISATAVYTEPKRIPSAPHEIFQQKFPPRQTRRRFQQEKDCVTFGGREQWGLYTQRWNGPPGNANAAGGLRPLINTLNPFWKQGINYIPSKQWGIYPTGSIWGRSSGLRNQPRPSRKESPFPGPLHMFLGLLSWAVTDRLEAWWPLARLNSRWLGSVLMTTTNTALLKLFLFYWSTVDTQGYIMFRFHHTALSEGMNAQDYFQRMLNTYWIYNFGYY